MKEIAVNSKIIAQLAYDCDCEKLHIVFRNKEARWFANVPAHIVGELVAAPSPGQYYIERIRNNFTRLAA
jgi:hypothetical protein